MIQLIDVNKLEPHPNNPRKDLGDLTELTDSIKESGVLQNLTVVPWFSAITGVGWDDPKSQAEAGYRVVIGHRRLAAAKRAGLTEVPCAVVKMSRNKQIATMLLENMQRNDLTIYEQANGFQMMIKFGEDVKSISYKTGLSQTTIRNRVKLMELDQEKLKKSIGQNVTINDYLMLNKVKDIDKRNELIDLMGTPNFKWRIENEIADQEWGEKKTGIIERLQEFASEGEPADCYGSSLVARYDVDSDIEEIIAPTDLDTEVYYFEEPRYSSYVELCKVIKGAQKKDQDKKKSKDDLRLMKRAQFDKLTILAHKMRAEYAASVSEATAKKHFTDIVKYAILGWHQYSKGNKQQIAELLMPEMVGKEVETIDLAKYADTNPCKYLLSTMINAFDSQANTYVDWYNDHRENKELDALYDLLTALGYQMSDEEKQLQDGTHLLFDKAEEEEYS